MHIVDRRLNPKGKSLANRQRFVRLARGEIKQAVERSLKKRAVSDIDSGEKVAIPAKRVAEPRFRQADSGGRREYVFPGNKEYAEGDTLPRPPGGEGGGRPKEGSPEGSGEDPFQFTLSREEFLDILFEDLELPDLVKTSLKDTQTVRRSRAGFQVSGTPANLNIVRTMRNSLARRISLKRPKQAEIDELERQIAEAEQAQAEGRAGAAAELDLLRARRERNQRRVKAIPYIDPVDVRYNRYDPSPQPNAQAVMFCLMDVSGSMSEYMKDLAKRFFILLHLFLKRRYRNVDIVFIRHTSEAHEVDEDTFFHSRDTGGTVVSSALKAMKEIVAKRYPLSEWNIYAAQASDGDNFTSDSDTCVQLLGEELMPLCQYYAYIEVVDEREANMFRSEANASELWRCYKAIGQRYPNFAMKRVFRGGDIFPVFHELFARGGVQAA